MTEQNRPVDIARRIATAQAHRSPVDANGHHTTKPSTFTYDLDGKLVSATSDPTPAESQAATKTNVHALIPDRKLPDDGPGSAAHGYLRPIA